MSPIVEQILADHEAVLEVLLLDVAAGELARCHDAEACQHDKWKLEGVLVQPFCECPPLLNLALG